MRALLYTKAWTLDVVDVETPTPPAGDVLIRVERAGICGSDVQGVATRSPRRTPPLIMGHELIGEVTSAPRDAGALIGCRVAVNPQIPCGGCSSCRSGHENICQHRGLVGGTRPGGFGEFVSVPERCVHVVADELPVDVAVLAEPVATCMHAFRLSPPWPGTVVVLGAGTIGTLACIVARLLGAVRVIVTESSDERRTWASAIADLAVRPEELKDALLAEPREGGAALVVDAVGSDATRAASVALLQPGGSALWLGMHDAEATIPAFDLVVLEQSIRGSFAYANADFEAAVDLLARHPEAFRIPTKTCSLEEGAHVFDALVAGEMDGFVKASLMPTGRPL